MYVRSTRDARIQDSLGLVCITGFRLFGAVIVVTGKQRFPEIDHVFDLYVQNIT